MYDLSKLFQPITAEPVYNENYIEIPPCDALKPYIRCYWGSPLPRYLVSSNDFVTKESVVIPDGCMDIIIDFEHITRRMDSIFIGISDRPIYTASSNETAVKSTFGIRFYFWAAYLFVDADLKGMCNLAISLEEGIRDFSEEIKINLLEYTAIQDRIKIVEKYLMKKLYEADPVNSDLGNAVYMMSKTRGRVKIEEIADYCCLSTRQLERVFQNHVGINVKAAADIVRFQNIWKDIYFLRNINYLDIVYRYGYTDQSHFIRDFKRFFGCTPTKAKNNVAFLQSV